MQVSLSIVGQAARFFLTSKWDFFQAPVGAAEPTKVLSINMDGWGAMTEAGGTQISSPGSEKIAAGYNPFGTESGTQMNSIAGWQAIAADVRNHFPNGCRPKFC